MSDYPEIEIYENPNQLAEAVADLFVREAIASIEKTNRFTVALSGGSTPRLAHQLFTTEKYSKIIPWDAVCLFWVDDRCVPYDDPASNYGAALEDFISKVKIPKTQVYPMPTTIEPQTGAMEYEKELLSAFVCRAGDIPSFDCIFLGVGTDGHTASLFPGQQELWEPERLIIAVCGGNPHVDRLTMTLPVINRAKHIVISVSGQAKAKTIEEIFAQPEKNYPIQNIKPAYGRVSWLIDKDAAGLLPLAASGMK